MGTWCEDSQREFPVFIKLLDQIEFNFNNLTLVGVDEDKIVPNLSEKEREKLNVFNVPTIIVYDKNGKEVNRFVEFPQQTLEEDLLKIFSGEDYKHVYDF
jgi:thiol-disulfide isomerase/thioredoxin